MNQTVRTSGRRPEDRCCPYEDEFEKIGKAHELMSTQLEAIEKTAELNGKTLDDLASAFVDKDYVKHRMMQKAELDRSESWGKIKQYVLQGVILAAVLTMAAFIFNAVTTRVATVVLPAASAGASR